MFDTFSQVIINECRMFYICDRYYKKTKINFLVRHFAPDNLICEVFVSKSGRQIKALRLNIITTA